MGILQQYDLIAGLAIFADGTSGPKPQRNSGGGFGGFTYSGDNAWKAWATPIAVSYTHLTLPTKA